MSVNTEQEPFIHPNMDQSKHTIVEVHGQSGLKAFIRKIDERYLKPFLIYNYAKVVKDKEEDFAKLVHPETAEEENARSIIIRRGLRLSNEKPSAASPQQARKEAPIVTVEEVRSEEENESFAKE